jgi:transposase InsO family protein
VNGRPRWHFSARLSYFTDGVSIARRTVTRQLAHLGLSRRKFLDPTGALNRVPTPILTRRPGERIHVDVKKVGRIPDGGGWRAHGRGSAEHRASSRAKTAGARAGYVYLHSTIDAHTRPAYTEPLADETAATAIAFFKRARAFFAAHGISRIERVITDNGSCYRAHDYTKALGRTRHQRTRPYTPRHNGKVERYQRILAEELLYARPWHSEAHRAHAISVWNIHYNYHRPHSAHGDQPPATALRHRVTNVMASYS